MDKLKPYQFYGTIPNMQEGESKVGIKKVRPHATVEFSNGIDGRDSFYYVHYTCPTCGKSIRENDIACDVCGTFFDWSKKAKIELVRTIVWE